VNAVIKEKFQIVRVLEDGQRIAASSLDDLNRAQRLVASLGECRPGCYVLIGPDSQSIPVLGHEEPSRG